MTTDLGQLEPGHACVVERLDLPRRESVRLMEMGLLPGTAVELIRRAPLGDPLLLRVRGYALSIRKSEASRIRVTAVRALTADRTGARDREEAPAEPTSASEGSAAGERG